MNRSSAHVFLVTIAGLILTGCAGTRITQLSGPEFLKKAEQTQQIGSFAWTSYIGSTYHRAYLEYGHPAFLGSGMQTTVYWTPVSELPSNIVVQIQAGIRPWTNWMDSVSQSTNFIYLDEPKPPTPLPR